MDNKQLLKIGSLVIIGFGFCGITSMFFHPDNKNLYVKIEALNQHVEQLQKERGTTHTIERIVSTAIGWRPIQEKVKDTVVQIYAQIAAIDMLQPYKTPTQGIASGSGFLIDDAGERYIVTNAHVVSQAKAVWVQIPSLGKTIIDVDIVGMSPDRDLALLRMTPEAKILVESVLQTIPFLPLGDSDSVYRSEEVLALGYPLGQTALKSTTGVISGRERNFIQISAPINPGSSGGPLLNTKGEVIGINSAGITEAQNVGYAIAIKDLISILPELKVTKLMRRPFLGLFFNNGSKELVQYLGNPQPGGCYIIGVVPESTCAKAGIQKGDMVYEINGYSIDLYGEMQVPWSEDKISIVDYAGRLPLGQEISLSVYRKGVHMELRHTFEMNTLPAIRKIFPGFEPIDYEIFGGMVIMPLTLNHVQLLLNDATGLAEYAEILHQNEPTLIVTHIFPNSQVHRVRSITIGSTLRTVNGLPVKTLDDLRSALKEGAKNKFATFAVKDNVSRLSEDIFVVLDYEKVIMHEPIFAADYKYPISETMRIIIDIVNMRTKIKSQES
jgi:serine protease Do